MRPKSSSSWLYRAILTLAIYALFAASWSQSLSVAAQTGDLSLDGSPVSIVGPTSESVAPGASQLEVEAGEAAVPVTTLAPPVVITVDTSGLISSGHPCLSIDPNWIAVELIPLADIYWTSPDESAGGNVFIDASTEPDSFSWDALGGGTIEGVIVPDEFGSRSATANFYDYRPFGGSIGGDAGLIAPAGLLTGAYLCLASPSTTSTALATAGAGDAAAGDDSDDVLTSEGDTSESNSACPIGRDRDRNDGADRRAAQPASRPGAERRRDSRTFNRDPSHRGRWASDCIWVHLVAAFHSVWHRLVGRAVSHRTTCDQHSHTYADSITSAVHRYDRPWELGARETTIESATSARNLRDGRDGDASGNARNRAGWSSGRERLDMVASHYATRSRMGCGRVSRACIRQLHTVSDAHRDCDLAGSHRDCNGFRVTVRDIAILSIRGRRSGAHDGPYQLPSCSGNTIGSAHRAGDREPRNRG